MGLILALAGIYHVLFGVWTNLWPHHFFDLGGITRPNHPVLWRGLGIISIALGGGLLLASRNPLRHWPIVLTAFLKCVLFISVFLLSLADERLPTAVVLLAVFDDFLWFLPLAAILWSALQVKLGRPPLHEKPLTLPEAAKAYRLSSGETLAEAAADRPVALVFLRHFGCTFTRRILRELETLKKHADQHDARLVLVHMLEEGAESAYLGSRDRVARIADPYCELYRAFGLGKGGFLELFGPRVWLNGFVAMFKGCGVGGLAGDGLQMPGAFLFHRDRIVSSQPARSASDMPDLPALFSGLSASPVAETVPA